MLAGYSRMILRLFLCVSVSAIYSFGIGFAREGVTKSAVLFAMNIYAQRMIFRCGASERESLSIQIVCDAIAGKMQQNLKFIREEYRCDFGVVR